MPSAIRRFASLFLFFAAFLLVIPLTGCKNKNYPKCKKDKHCKVDLGEKCVDGICQNCTTDEDCKAKGPNGEDFKCHEFRCTDPAAVEGAVGNLGEPCTQATDCTGGLVCKAGVCDKCTEDLECSPGTCDIATGLCSTGTGGGACSTDDDCQIDEICDGGTCVFSGVEPGAGGNPCGIDAVFFDFDSPTIKPDAQQQLTEIAECLKQQNKNVFLEAHADPRGTEEYNILLTDKRGQSVKRFLEDLGVSPELLQVISKGALEATGNDAAGFAKDRRVEFIFP